MAFCIGIARFGANFPFRDAAGLAKYPVDGPQLPHSRVVIREYQPEERFTQTLVIPNTRLREWESQSSRDRFIAGSERGCGRRSGKPLRHW